MRVPHSTKMDAEADYRSGSFVVGGLVRFYESLDDHEKKKFIKECYDYIKLAGTGNHEKLPYPEMLDHLPWWKRVITSLAQTAYAASFYSTKERKCIRKLLYDKPKSTKTYADFSETGVPFIIPVLIPIGLTIWKTFEGQQSESYAPNDFSQIPLESRSGALYYPTGTSGVQDFIPLQGVCEKEEVLNQSKVLPSLFRFAERAATATLSSGDFGTSFQNASNQINQSYEYTEACDSSDRVNAAEGEPYGFSFDTSDDVTTPAAAALTAAGMTMVAAYFLWKYLQPGPVVDTLWDASLNGKIETVRTLVESEDVNEQNQAGETPLFAASSNGHVDVVNLLIEAGASVNRAKHKGTTPLWIASQEGYDSIVKLLIEKGANVNQAQHNGTTPLYIASQEGHVAVVDLLLRENAAVDEANDKKVTPLIVASQSGHVEIIQRLIESGAFVNQNDSDGDTPLYVAAEAGEFAAASFLLQSGATIDKGNGMFETPLYTAVKNKHADVVRLLVEKGANVDHMARDGSTPVTIATGNIRALLNIVPEAKRDVYELADERATRINRLKEKNRKAENEKEGAVRLYKELQKKLEKNDEIRTSVDETRREVGVLTAEIKSLKNEVRASTAQFNDKAAKFDQDVAIAKGAMEALLADTT